MTQSATAQPETVTSATRIIPITDWPKFHPWPSVAGLRHLIVNAKDNGFKSVVRRYGRRVLIDERSFFQWMEKFNDEAN